MSNADNAVVHLPWAPPLRYDSSFSAAGARLRADTQWDDQCLNK